MHNLSAVGMMMLNASLALYPLHISLIPLESVFLHCVSYLSPKLRDDVWQKLMDDVWSRLRVMIIFRLQGHALVTQTVGHGEERKGEKTNRWIIGRALFILRLSFSLILT